MASDIRAVIVAGGFGTRAQPMTNDSFPKALLPVAGVPIIFRQMRVLAREGIKELVVLAGHLGAQLQQALAPEAAGLGIDLKIQVEEVPLGTGGCLTTLPPAAGETLIVFGDILFDLALDRLAAFHRGKGAMLTAVAHPNDHPRTSDLIRANNGLITAVLPRGAPREADYRNLVPAGLYLASPDFFARLIKNKSCELFRDVLPRLIASGAPVAVYDTPEYFRDVGSPARHTKAETDLAAGLPGALNARHKRPAIFFDCDGVLNEEPGMKGVLRPDQVKLMPGAAGAVATARAAHQLAIAVTNRPQVARGDISFDDLDRILGRLEALLTEGGGVLDRVYFCPHHPDKGFPGEVAALKIACECRKPGALLFRQAATEMPIDMARSSSIGDSLRDIGAARAAGVYAYGVRTGYGCRDAERYPGGVAAAPIPDLMFADVGEAAAYCVRYQRLAEPILAKLRALKKGAPPQIVAICGHSRSGKSLIAHAVARSLRASGTPALQVRLDDWIVPAEARTQSMTGPERSRVEALPGILAALRAGEPVTAPGYDAASRGSRPGPTYNPAGQAVIVVDGLFAAHDSIRPAVDLAVFVELPPERERERFEAFYRWKGITGTAIDELWRARKSDEWPAVDAQRPSADITVSGDNSR